MLHATRSAIVDAGADARRQLKALIITARAAAGQPARACMAAAGSRLRDAGGRAGCSGGPPRTVRALRMTAERVLPHGVSQPA